LCVLTIVLGTSTFAYAEEAPTGILWTLTGMDLDVVLNPEDETLKTTGVMTLRCEAESSPTIQLVLNSRQAVMEFVSVEGTVASVELNIPDGEHAALRYARIELVEPARKGDEVQLRFETKGTGKGYQIRIDPDVATASWTDVWYPYPDDYAGRSLSQRTSVTGTTVIRMPTDWTSLSGGQLVSRTEEGEVAIETWRLDVPLPRSFAAGPYDVARHRIGEREMSVYLLAGKEATAREQAELLGRAIEALEQRFGPYPYPSYGIAEVPPKRFDWYAANQPGMIFADASSFQVPGGNLPLFAHEAAHAWWGHLVGGRGPGSIVTTESLAQYSAVVALESIRGIDAAVEFLNFSAPRYPRRQCARGYFEMIDRGEDLPLSELGTGGWQHDLSDAKGHWVYHMLRQRVGDELFFATLRDLIDTYRGWHMSLDDLRAAFVQAAGPEAELETFFEQWLDRAGAPELELQWAFSPTDQGGLVEGTIRQVQTGEPYHLLVTLAPTRSGSSVGGEHVVEITERRTEFSLAVDERVDEIVLDPHHHILMWRPEYRSLPWKRLIFIAAVAIWLGAVLVFQYRRWKNRRKSGSAAPAGSA
jgi:aminopeptidase N